MEKLLVGLLLLSTLGFLAVPVVGQSDEPDVGNATVTESEETQIQYQLNEQTWISNITFKPQSDEAVIRLQTNRSAPTGVTINEMVPLERADGAVQVAPQEFSVRPDGTTVVTAFIRSYEGCQGLSIQTRFERNSTVIPSDGCNGVDLVDRESKWSDVTILVAVTIVTIFFAIIAAGLIHRKVSSSQFINVFEYINNNRLFK